MGAFNGLLQQPGPREYLSARKGEAMSKRKMITLSTSQKHRVLLDTALARAYPGTSLHAHLLRLGDQLDTYGNMTSAQIGMCISTIFPSS
jgi:hypothetical protein